MSKFLDNLRGRIDDELKKFEETREESPNGYMSGTRIGKMNNKLSQFIEKSQEK